MCDEKTRLQSRNFNSPAMSLKMGDELNKDFCCIYLQLMEMIVSQKKVKASLFLNAAGDEALDVNEKRMLRLQPMSDTFEVVFIRRNVTYERHVCHKHAEKRRREGQQIR